MWSFSASGARALAAGTFPGGSDCFAVRIAAGSTEPSTKENGMPGPPPKAPGQRRRRNVASTARTLVPLDQGGLPAIPKPQLLDRPDGSPWHSAAVEMWDAVWDSPMSAEFDTSDVHGLMRLLDLVHLYWTIDPYAKGAIRTKVLLGAEIRLQSQNFGLSPLDRRRLQWEILRTEEAADAGQRRRSARQQSSDPRTKF